VLTGKTTVSNIKALREAGDHLRDKLGSGVVVLGAVIDGEPKLLAMVTQDAINKGLSAGNIMKGITPAVGGQGGGAPNKAEGGGPDAAGLDKALEMVPGLVAQTLGVEG
jgi:alanyl-tRNA synthetase